jgi:hypothetical protein
MVVEMVVVEGVLMAKEEEKYFVTGVTIPSLT